MPSENGIGRCGNLWVISGIAGLTAKVAILAGHSRQIVFFPSPLNPDAQSAMQGGGFVHQKDKIYLLHTSQHRPLLLRNFQPAFL